MRFLAADFTRSMALKHPVIVWGLKYCEYKIHSKNVMHRICTDNHVLCHAQKWVSCSKASFLPWPGIHSLELCKPSDKIQTESQNITKRARGKIAEISRSSHSKVCVSGKVPHVTQIYSTLPENSPKDEYLLWSEIKI